MSLVVNAAWDKIKQATNSLPKPVGEAMWIAGKSVLGALLPGAAPAIDLTKVVVDWAMEKNASPQPQVAANDLERVTEVIRILTQRVDDVVQVLARMPADKQEQGEGWIRQRMIHDSDMPAVLWDLEEEVRNISVLKTHYRNLLRRKGYSDQVLEEMLLLTMRFVGLSEVIPELEAAKERAKLSDKEGQVKILSAVQSFQEAARSYCDGNFTKATQSFKQVVDAAQTAAIARVAFDTAAIAAGPLNSDTERRVHDIVHRLPPPPLVGERSLRFGFPMKDEDILTTFSNGRGVKDVILWNASNLSDAGIRILCESLPSLTRLSIRKGRRLTDGSIPHICKLQSLERLLIWGSQLTPVGIKRLQAIRHWENLNIR